MSDEKDSATEPSEETFVSLGIWELAWPAIIGNLLNSSVSIVGAIAVGTLGAAALAATTAGERIFFVLQAVLMAITAGTTALVARAWGAGDRVEAGGFVGERGCHPRDRGRHWQRPGHQ